MHVATQYAYHPLQVDNIFAFFRQVAVLFRHVGYLRHQQQVDLWPFDLESGVRVEYDVGYLYANFSLPGPSVLELGLMNATDRQTDIRRQRDVRQKYRLMFPLYRAGGIINSRKLAELRRVRCGNWCYCLRCILQNAAENWPGRQEASSQRCTQTVTITTPTALGSSQYLNLKSSESGVPSVMPPTAGVNSRKT